MARRSRTSKRGIPVYISSKTGELAQMAEYGGYPLIAYLLRIAQAEAKRTRVQRDPADEPAPPREKTTRSDERARARRIAG